jgi:hypothetical protein
MWTRTYWSVLVRTNLYQYQQEQDFPYWYNPLQICTRQYQIQVLSLEQLRWYQQVQDFPNWYKAVQDGTRQDQNSQTGTGWYVT